MDAARTARQPGAVGGPGQYPDGGRPGRGRGAAPGRRDGGGPAGRRWCRRRRGGQPDGRPVAGPSWATTVPGLVADVPAGRDQPPDQVDVLAAPQTRDRRARAPSDVAADDEGGARDVGNPAPRSNRARLVPRGRVRSGPPRSGTTVVGGVIAERDDAGRHRGDQGVVEVGQQRVRASRRWWHAVRVDEGHQRRGRPGPARRCGPPTDRRCGQGDELARRRARRSARVAPARAEASSTTRHRNRLETVERVVATARAGRGPG